MIDGARQARKADRQEAGRPGESAAAQRPLRREVLHAGHDEHDPQPRPERRDHRRPGEAPAIRASPTIATAASSRCSAKWRSNIDMEKFDHIFDARKHKAKAKLDTDLTRRRSEGHHRRLQEAGPEGNQEAVSRRMRTSSLPCRATPCSGSWWNPKATYYRKMEKIPGRHRHRRQRAGHGVRQHGRHFGHRRRLHARSRDRREGVLRRIPDERAGRGRGRRHPHAAADSRSRKDHAGSLRAAARDHRRASKSTTTTCRISSSPSRKASCTCCRPATASAPVRRRCASRWRWWKKA